MRRALVALLTALAVMGATQVATTGATAATTIPTIRVWEGGPSIGRYYDLGRDQKMGIFNIPFDPTVFYVPTGWCAETNTYFNNGSGILVIQTETTGPGWRYVDHEGYYYSVYIHAPGSDGICN
jgi:hypothetical protein